MLNQHFNIYQKCWTNISKKLKNGKCWRRRPAAQPPLARASKLAQGRGGCCRCLNHSTSMGGTRNKVEGGDRHDLEPEGTREDTRHEIYTGSGSQSSYPTSCLE
jgi:hypothetical protein